ncbi:MAG: CRISPR system precrRNA processing endoribonuclease RAMP protein Cas6 [Lachnospiraceae bacterium]|nr:CRISPR system precrRNA processing endoribonuclease RAMP protein Cas6 [Lachnospiraceae bacterium]
MYIDNYEQYLNIPYVKLHFTARVEEACRLPRNKASALRGGVGQMMILQNCILASGSRTDEDCCECSCREECLVQRFLYTPVSVQPAFSAEKLSMGYLFECENYYEGFDAGEMFDFQVILFGKSRVYLNLLLQAVWALGQQGLGKEKGRFSIVRILNSRKEDILCDGYGGMQIRKDRYYPETFAGYAQFRMRQLQKNGCHGVLKFQTETDIRFRKERMLEFNMEAIVAALTRRAYLFNCFEGTDMDLDIFMEEMLSDLPQICSQKVNQIQVKRFSSRQMSSMRLGGIKGEVWLDGLPGQLLPWLLAGEIMHIGKNTSFGFGRYRVF